jgi:hypothetical protein
LLLTLCIFSFISDLSGEGSVAFNHIFKRFFVLFLTVLAAKGGMQLLMRKTRGWEISLSLLIFFSGVMAYGFTAGYFSGVETITAIIIQFLLVLGVVLLFSTRTKLKFQISKKNAAPVVLLTATLALLYVFIQ